MKLFSLSALSERRDGPHNLERIRVNDSNLKVRTLAVIAAISEEQGLIDYVVHPKAIKTEVFVTFIN